MCKYLIISGGVFSGTGKGISAASLGLLLKMRGENIQLIKFDPYLNFSSTNIRPSDHGEIFLAADGSETDLDLGSYYRISGIEMSSQNICTSGKIYREVLDDEVNGNFLGQTVQLIPHVSDKIIEKLEKLGSQADIVICEIGGVCGDLESGIFFEAIRQLKQKVGDSNFLIAHVAPILWVDNLQEFKTKPLQNSVRELQKFGLSPDILLCRTSKKVPPTILDKISLMTGIQRNAIFEGADAQSIYQVPIFFYDCHIDDFIADKFRLRRNGVRIHNWRHMVDRLLSTENQVVNIAVVGKYVGVNDAYLSLKEAIHHAAMHLNLKAEIKWIDAEKLEEYTTLKGLDKFFENIDSIIVPGGFGKRGFLGKIKAVRYAREKKIPFLGICLGLQCATVEFARNVLNIENADSVEFNKDCIPVIHFVKEMKNIHREGGVLRLGSYDCILEKNSLIGKLYGRKTISERHRHRYEVNPEYIPLLENKGFKIVGINPDENLVEAMELDQSIHPHFTACQYHPEFKSRFDCPHPLFVGLLAACKKKEEVLNNEK